METIMVKNRMQLIKERIKSENINGLVHMKLDIFEDYRGEIWTVYSEDYCDYKFVADKITISNKGVLRGFHGDPYTAKLITCLSGKFQLAVVDLREGSQTYGNVDNFIISDNEPSIVIVPEGCVNAHLCLSEKCVFYYKWSEQYRGSENQATIAWDDPKIGVNWAIKNPILSERDKNGTSFDGVVL
jgi:dTDP-4-dehydrorhamnose 3,5-epimerase